MKEFFKRYPNASKDPNVWRKIAQRCRDVSHLQQLSYMPEVQALYVAKINEAMFFEQLAESLESSQNP